MALFKPFRGNRATLDAQSLHDGYAYFCIDDGSFHIDYINVDGDLQRKQLTAREAEKILGYDITNTLNPSDTEIASSKAIFDALEALKTSISDQLAVILFEAQTDSSNKAAVVLAEVQKSIGSITNNGSSKISTISLPASNWIAITNTYSQVVSVAGVTANSKIDICPTPEQLIELQNAGIALMAVNEDGIVTVYAINNKPSTDYAMQVTITEVEEG